MTIYLDLVGFLNFAFDFLLLLTVNITLKRNVSLKRVFLGALFGSLTILFLFLPITTIVLFLLKILTSFLMCLITFRYKNIKYTIQNMLYFYMTGTILGGFLYYLNLEFSYKREGLVFFHHGLSVNYLFLLISSPIILYSYVRSQKKLKTQYSCYYQIGIQLKSGEYFKLNAFLDTGNKLKDPVTEKGIILVEKKAIKEVRIRSPIYVPYNSLGNHGLLECISPEYIELNGKRTKKYLLGISKEQFHIDGIECILNANCMEEIT